MKALEQLAQQGHVREKTYGKQKIYFADQVSPGRAARWPRLPRTPDPPLPAGAAPGCQRCGAPRAGRENCSALRRAASGAAELPAHGGG